jgi:hypothetical protein
MGGVLLVVEIAPTVDGVKIFLTILIGNYL